MTTPFRRGAQLGLATVIALAPCSSWALPLGGTGPRPVNFQPENLADAASHFAPANLASLKGVRRVVIPQFQVEYVTRSQALNRKERNQVTVEYSIAGVGDEAMQAETDKLYERFVDGLKATGVEVVSRDALTASPSWAKLAAVAKPSGGAIKTESGSGRLFTAGAVPYYFYPGDAHLGTAALGWAFSQAQMTEQALSAELGAAVVTVRLVVGIRETDKHSQLLAVVRTASSFVGDPKLDLEADASGVFAVVAGKTGGVMNPTARAGLTARNHLVFAEDVLAPSLKDSTSAAGTAGNVASTALFAGNLLASAYGGGIGMKLRKSYSFQSSPAEAEYIAAVDRNVSAAEDALLMQLKPALALEAPSPAN